MCASFSFLPSLSKVEKRSRGERPRETKICSLACVRAWRPSLRFARDPTQSDLYPRPAPFFHLTDKNSERGGGFSRVRDDGLFSSLLAGIAHSIGGGGVLRRERLNSATANTRARPAPSPSPKPRVRVSVSILFFVWAQNVGGTAPPPSYIIGLETAVA